MTNRPQRSSHDPVSDAAVRCRAEIDVHVSDTGDFHFVPTYLENVAVREDGEIRLLERFGPNERAEIRFRPADPGGELAGIQLGISDAHWKERPVTVDTGGAYYVDERREELPFRVTPLQADAPTRGFLLSEIAGLTPPEINPFWYTISGGPRGKTFQHDPMLYNKGDGGPPPGSRRAERS